MLGDDDDDGDDTWTIVGLVKTSRPDDWMHAKRMGPGRRPLLSGVRPHAKKTLLFSAAVYGLRDEEKLVFEPFRTGQAALPEVVRSIVGGGSKPLPFVVQYIANSGISPTNIVWTLRLRASADKAKLLIRRRRSTLGDVPCIAPRPYRNLLGIQISRVRTGTWPTLHTRAAGGPVVVLLF